MTCRALRIGADAGQCARNVVVVADHDNQMVGLLVESVSEILSIDRDRIQDTPDIRSESVTPEASRGHHRRRQA